MNRRFASTIELKKIMKGQAIFIIFKVGIVFRKARKIEIESIINQPII